MICLNTTLRERRRLAFNSRAEGARKDATKGTRLASEVSRNYAPFLSRLSRRTPEIPRPGTPASLVRLLFFFAFVTFAPAFAPAFAGLEFWSAVCFGQDSASNSSTVGASTAAVAPAEALVQQTVNRGLDWLAGQQARNGSWSAQNGGYVTAMTSLAVLALTAEGSTTMQGKYSVQIRRGVDFLLTQARPTGLIGVPHDGQYTYGHGYAMMALAQVLGEEEDVDRREQLIKILVRAVAFTVDAQTKDGGWGYVSAKQGSGFDEGSTTVTQVQGLRACRNAGITVPKSCIDKAIQYIQRCTTDDGGVQYTTKGGPGRPAITAAAIASLYNAGDYDDAYVPKLMDFCKKNINDLDQNAMGYWHYAHFYYAQVMYRTGGPEWDDYRARIVKRLIDEAGPNGAWSQGFVGDVYTTSKNLIILQLDQNILPIFQR